MAMISLFLASVALYWLGWVFYARWFHPYAKYSGPFLASISRLWYVLELWGGKIDKTQKALHERFGPVVRIAPDEVVISDPSAVKTIYAASSGFTKTDFYPAFDASWGKYPSTFAATDPRVHTARRKIVNHVYSMSNVARYEQGIDTCSQLFLGGMVEATQKGEPIDMAVWCRWYAFDVVGQLFFSRPFGFLERKEDCNNWIHATDLLMPVMITGGIVQTYVRPLLQLGAIAVPRFLRGLLAIKMFEGVAEKSIADRQVLLEKGGGILEREDLLASLFRIMEERGKEVDFGPLDIKTEIWVALLAGSDTVSVALTSILYFLMKNPEDYRKLQAEIDLTTANGQLSNPHISYSEAAKLPYLDACIKEATRMHPSVAMSLPRHVPKGGRDIAGHFFPEGAKVGVNAMVMHRDKGVFGDDADEFKPERWFRENAADMERHMLNFGGGPHTCIGKNIALCEMYKLIPEMLRAFNLQLCEPEKEWTLCNHWFNHPRKIYTRVSPRAQGVS